MIRHSSLVIPRFLLILGLLVLAVAGCAPKPYRQADLAVDSPEGRAVAADLAALKSGGRAGIATFLRTRAANDPARLALLQWALGQLAAADAVELRSLDAFGPDVVRAVISVKQGAAEQETTFLLVRKDGRLLWASPN